MTSVLIADDHPMVRAGLRQFLEEDRSISEIGEAASGNETLERLRTRTWHLLLLDINMPDRSGFDILRHIRASYSETRILVLSGLPARQYALSALKAGAHGYLAKECTAAELLKAMHEVLQGRRYLSAALAEILLSHFDGDSDKPLHSRLSEREFQIFCKLAAGRTVCSIAGELFLSEKTVSTYRKRILEKMSLTTNADLTAYGVRSGIVQ
jgi:two-component system, NarL family, invasion response regulator UvrY